MRKLPVGENLAECSLHAQAFSSVPCHMQTPTAARVQVLDVVFVAVYQHMLSIPYVDGLLQGVKLEFSRMYRPGVLDYPQFGAVYNLSLIHI